jgi:hypothetical protein
MVGDADFGEEAMKLLILPAPARLDSNNFPVKGALRKLLEFNKFLENFIFEFQGVDPREFTIVINKAHIILFAPNRFRSITPHIKINKL